MQIPIDVTFAFVVRIQYLLKLLHRLLDLVVVECLGDHSICSLRTSQRTVELGSAGAFLQQILDRSLPVYQGGGRSSLMWRHRGFPARKPRAQGAAAKPRRAKRSPAELLQRC